MIHSLRVRLLALVSVLTLMVCLTGSLSTLTVTAATSLDALEEQLKDLQAQEKEIKNELASASSDLSASKKR